MAARKKTTSPRPRRKKTRSRRAVETTVSGRYRPVSAANVPVAPGDPLMITQESLSLDVDGDFPLNVASGLLRSGIARSLQWISRLRDDGNGQFSGRVFYKIGEEEIFPYSFVSIEMLAPGGDGEPRLRATFSGGGVSRSRDFRRAARSFRVVDFEFDQVSGVTPVMTVDTAAHPNRPADLPAENLSIQEVFRRAGFRVTTSSGGGNVPIAGAGADSLWGDSEMHDAMQASWSRFSDTAQWALWVFYAARHSDGFSLGGIMFDEYGPRHRQGTAIFCDSFIARAPANDVAPQAWRDRSQFWTACHEMGHAFNLAHSWDKGDPVSWIPMVSRPESRSFMNYPDSVQGGQSKFYKKFRFRFDDGELLFMRHAPETFVQMGNADFFDNHAFRNADVPETPSFRLELRDHRDSRLEFLEPLMMELKLTNVSRATQHVRSDVLADHSRLVFIIKPDRQPARRYVPFARYCRAPETIALARGKSLYELLFAGADLTGWPAAEPGCYTIQALVSVNDEDVVSNPIRVRVAPPETPEVERFAQDYFSTDVGRVMAFDGSRLLTAANDTLEELVARPSLSSCRAAVHARVALGMVKTEDRKVLTFSDRKGEPPRLQHARAKPEEAKKLLEEALEKKPAVAAETLGHIDFNYYSRAFARWLAEQGERKDAQAVIDSAVKTLRRRKVIPAAISELQSSLRST